MDTAGTTSLLIKTLISCSIPAHALTVAIASEYQHSHIATAVSERPRGLSRSDRCFL
jgi:hypothetical protein